MKRSLPDVSPNAKKSSGPLSKHLRFGNEGYVEKSLAAQAARLQLENAAGEKGDQEPNKALGAKEKATLHDLPENLLVDILKYCPTEDLVNNVSLVNSTFHRLCQDMYIWTGRYVACSEKTTDETLKHMMEFTPGLSGLTLRDNSAVTEQGIREVFSNGCNTLKWLSLPTAFARKITAPRKCDCTIRMHESEDQKRVFLMWDHVSVVRRPFTDQEITNLVQNALHSRRTTFYNNSDYRIRAALKKCLQTEILEELIVSTNQPDNLKIELIESLKDFEQLQVFHLVSDQDFSDELIVQHVWKNLPHLEYLETF